MLHARVEPKCCDVGWYNEGLRNLWANPILITSKWPKCMGWIIVSWKLLTAVAVMQFHRRCVVLALLWKLRFCTKIPGFLEQWGCIQCCGSVGHLALQSFKCVWAWDTLCAYVNSLSVFTVLGTAVLSSLHSGVVVKLILYLHQTPSWLWLVWSISPVFTPTGCRPVGTTVQTIPGLWTCIKSANTRTLYTIYKVLPY